MFWIESGRADLCVLGLHCHVLLIPGGALGTHPDNQGCGIALQFDQTEETNAAKRVKKIQNATAMIWKLLPVAETYFSTLKGHWLLPDACRGKKFLNGVMKDDLKALERMAA